MGFFSQDCEGCGHPLLSPAATDPINRWMMQGVAIQPNGSIIFGVYDGYGRLDDTEGAVGNKGTVYHRACWVKAGEPTAYTGESTRSDDQGWFFADGAHDMAEPK